MELDLNLGILRLFSAFFVVCSFCFGLNLDYSLIKKGVESNNTLLVIGGIQGDEPGGFLAAGLLATEYEVKKGSLWIVPNLNFLSIIKRDRGIYGDMNRKFANIDKNDPDLKSVEGIKSLIVDKNVSMVLNLHDGSGFYRPTYINQMENPKRWGNSCIIDQSTLSGVKYGNLEEIANKVTDKINENILEEKHKYHIRNTRTAEGDLEMLKSLTYFAITKNKAAFANEASKSLPSHIRAYYHLLAIEEYMKIAGIEFERSFKMTPSGVKSAIEKEIEVVLFDDKFYLSLDNPRSEIGYIPIPKDTTLEYNTSNPLTILIKDEKGYKVHYGNRVLTKLIPQYFSYAKGLDEVEVIVDGEKKKIKLGSKIKAKENIKISKIDKVRVNFIGFNSKNKNEAGELIKSSNLVKKYSIDKKGKIYRVELYDAGSSKDKFIGMFLVEFGK